MRLKPTRTLSFSGQINNNFDRIQRKHLHHIHQHLSLYNRHTYTKLFILSLQVKETNTLIISLHS
jgi:hypothetical protein